MLTEVGRVIAVEGDGLWVETIRSSTCSSCGARKACGHGLANQIRDGERGLVRVLPGDAGVESCAVDDQVVISLPEEIILRGSFIAYVLPLVGMLGGALVALEFLPGNPDVLSALGAVAGLAVGFALVRLHSVAHRGDPRYQPVLLQNLGPVSQPLRVQ
ncbi:MAG: SoxR reducing system RseC family protein [Halioglobus sp.]|nr:SoxR reducing system RseC family protein [Halioglobus sp.]